MPQSKPIPIKDLPPLLKEVYEELKVYAKSKKVTGALTSLRKHNRLYLEKDALRDYHDKAIVISGNMTWSFTPEGTSFWEDFYKTLD